MYLIDFLKEKIITYEHIDSYIIIFLSLSMTLIQSLYSFTKTFLNCFFIYFFCCLMCTVKILLYSNKYFNKIFWKLFFFFYREHLYTRRLRTFGPLYDMQDHRITILNMLSVFYLPKYYKKYHLAQKFYNIHLKIIWKKFIKKYFGTNLLKNS